MINTPPSLVELKQNLRPIRQVNQEHRQSLTRLERMALWITTHVGTMGFFVVIFIWTLGWLTWNSFAPIEHRFDPFPAFVLWLFISNMIQILLMPLLLVGQNLQSRHAEIRAESEYELNVKAEKEIEAILMHLEAQNEKLLEISRKIEHRSSGL